MCCAWTRGSSARGNPRHAPAAQRAVLTGSASSANSLGAMSFPGANEAARFRAFAAPAASACLRAYSG
eukprot:7201796-Pyramimonas_sp.AAC.1